LKMTADKLIGLFMTDPKTFVMTEAESFLKGFAGQKIQVDLKRKTEKHIERIVKRIGGAVKDRRYFPCGHSVRPDTMKFKLELNLDFDGLVLKGWAVGVEVICPACVAEEFAAMIEEKARDRELDAQRVEPQKVLRRGR